MNRYSYSELPPAEKLRARSRFLDAGENDGYHYELDQNGEVLCRHRVENNPREHQPVN